MQQTLATLESYIQKLRPELYTDLQSPLSAEEFRALEQNMILRYLMILKRSIAGKMGNAIQVMKPLLTIRLSSH